MLDPIIAYFKSLSKDKRYLVLNSVILAGIFLLGSLPFVTTVLCVIGAILNLYAAFIDKTE
jgi:hypothetical protein